MKELFNKAQANLIIWKLAIARAVLYTMSILINSLSQPMQQ